jgi:hypothetical protein
MSRTRNGTNSVYMHLFLVGKRLEVDGDLCGKIGFGDKPSLLNMRYFHEFVINIYCGRK